MVDVCGNVRVVISCDLQSPFQFFCVSFLGGEDLLEGEDLLLSLLELGLPLLPLPLLLLCTELLEVAANHRVSRGVDVLKKEQIYHQK